MGSGARTWRLDRKAVTRGGLAQFLAVMTIGDRAPEMVLCCKGGPA